MCNDSHFGIAHKALQHAHGTVSGRAPLLHSNIEEVERDIRSRAQKQWGFTGTQKGMTVAQQNALSVLFMQVFPTHLFHGDCIGADAMADALAHQYGARVGIYPPEDSSRRAFCQRAAWRVYEPLPFLERNHRIVDACSILIATPAQSHEIRRSGTWATIRYAIKKGCPVICILPDGTVARR